MPALQDQPEIPQARLQYWRACEQRVRRMWNAWLVAPARDRDSSYEALVSALAEEERAAAEIERALEEPALRS
jgi:hypothetical protein